MPALLTADSVTELDARHRGAVLVAGSHGGRIAACYASRAGVHAVILNDAGIGKQFEARINEDSGRIELLDTSEGTSVQFEVKALNGSTVAAAK